MSLLASDLSAFVGHELRMYNLTMPGGPKAAHLQEAMLSVINCTLSP